MWQTADAMASNEYSNVRCFAYLNNHLLSQTTHDAPRALCSCNRYIKEYSEWRSRIRALVQPSIHMVQISDPDHSLN